MRYDIGRYSYDLALKIATEAHEGQFRWDGKTPYITHPIAVATNVAYLTHQYMLTKEELARAQMTALLHDVLEDTNLNPEDLSYKGIPEEVITDLCTLNKKCHDNYAKMIQCISYTTYTTVVKIADLKHNLSTLDPVKNKTLKDKYEMALLYLEEMTQ